jgi:hypothetical protein
MCPMQCFVAELINHLFLSREGTDLWEVWYFMAAF